MGQARLIIILAVTFWAGGAQGAPAHAALTAEETQKLGIVTTSAEAVTYSPDSEAFGVVVSHEVIAQVVADLETAQAAARLSQTALARGRRLARGPGALGTDTLEAATRQVASDEAALVLARRKLTAALGLGFPWQTDAARGELEKLADGTLKLARITFPAGVFRGGTPGSVRVSSLDSGTQNASWVTSKVWDAPQDPGLPGRSFFALLGSAEIAEGSRLQALAISPDGVPGVLIPDTALIVSNGSYWCYVKRKDSFVRAPMDVHRPLAGGYFVTGGVAVGDEVVTSGAALLLAREMNSGSAEAD